MHHSRLLLLLLLLLLRLLLRGLGAIGLEIRKAKKGRGPRGREDQKDALISLFIYPSVSFSLPQARGRSPAPAERRRPARRRHSRRSPAIQGEEGVGVRGGNDEGGAADKQKTDETIDKR